MIGRSYGRLWDWALGLSGVGVCVYERLRNHLAEAGGDDAMRQGIFWATNTARGDFAFLGGRCSLG